MRKTIFFLVAIFSIVVSCYFIFFNKSKDENRDSSYNEEIDEVIDVSLDKWQDNLIGHWKYEEIYTNSRNIQQLIGEKQYESNGKFVNYITYNLYNCKDMDNLTLPPEMRPGCLHIVIGGSYTGDWKVDTTKKVWGEKIEICNLNKGIVDKGFKDPDFCNSYFSPGNNLLFGAVEDSISKFKIVKLTKNEIITKGHFYHNGKDCIIRLNRIME